MVKSMTLKHYIKTTLILSLVGFLAVWVANHYPNSRDNPLLPNAKAQANIVNTQRIDFLADAPVSPRPSASITGASGGTQYNYWVVANYPIGSSLPGGPFTIFGPAALSAMNAIRVTWPAVGGATSYDVLRSATPASPLTSGACVACAVATGLLTTATTDTGGALGAYTLGSTIPPATGYMYLDNRDASSPRFVINPGIVGPSGSSTVYVNIDGTPSLTGSGEVVYLGTTGLEGDDTFNYDSTAGSLLLTVKSATFPLADGLITRGYGLATIGTQLQYAAGTPAAPTYPQVGDGMGNWNVQGWNENTGAFATAAGIIVDAGTNWSATNNDASMDFYINGTGTLGNGTTVMSIQPNGGTGVGIGFNINQLTGGIDGDLHVADNRAVTGDTSVVIQAGAGQTADMLIFQDNTGTAMSTSVSGIGVFRVLNSALEPVDCTAGIVGSQYFDTTDNKLCICADDGTDIEWVTSDDYSHATGHCSIA